VGGMVGVLGGLGGFTLPILFGLMSDLTNIRTSCFMLLFGLVSVCMVWMNYSILQLKKDSELFGETS
ncbi:MAG: MFS transporter, partial [Gammaproteobacteria bacterium]